MSGDRWQAKLAGGRPLDGGLCAIATLVCQWIYRLYPFQRWTERQKESLTYDARGLKFGDGFSIERAFVVCL